jgi:hypothetical protein
MQQNPHFWREYDAEKHAALIRAKNQSRMVWFAIIFLSGTTLVFLVLLTAIAFGKAKLPDAMVNVLAAATIGQFGGAPILLYKALYRKEDTK